MHFYEKTINNITINDIILKINLYKKIEIDWHDYQTVTQYGYDLGDKYPIGHDVYYSMNLRYMENAHIVTNPLLCLYYPTNQLILNY